MPTPESQPRLPTTPAVVHAPTGQSAATPDRPQEFLPLDQLVIFLREIDLLKTVERRSWLMNGSRRENSAEHSWHIALMAMLLAPYANEPVNVDRVVRMLLVHDLVEIYAGDTFAYDRPGRQAAALREDEAAARLFNLLPELSRPDFLSLWQEFEAQTTPESRFAKAMDRFMPLLHNFYTQGATWREYNISLEQVLELNRPIEHGSVLLWRFVQDLLERALEAGYLHSTAPTGAPTVAPGNDGAPVS